MHGRFTETEALIVGAGPTGLMAALELASRGIDARVIDKADSLPPKSGALILQSRTLELLQRQGLADEFVAAGRKVSRAEFVLAHGERREVELGDVGAEDSRFPFLLFLRQMDAVRILEKKLSALGKWVERPVELLTCLDAGDRAVATLQHEGGRREVVRARYLVGCDGVNSAVRKSAGIAFEGAPYHQDFVQADVEINWQEPLSCDVVRVALPRRGLLLVIPSHEPASCRIIASGPKMVSGGGEEDLTLRQLQQVFDELSPLAGKMTNVRWFERFRLHHQVAERYRRGRIFLAGDAAQAHGPTGGKGESAGLQDAANLGWKLALVLAGRASDTLLDSYEQERRPLAEKWLRRADRLVAISASPSPVFTGARNFAASFLLPRLARRRTSRSALFRLVSQLGVRYSDSSVVAEDMTNADGDFRRAPGKGARAPDGPLWLLPAGEPTTVHARLTGGAHHLLLFARTSEAGLSLIESVKRRLPIPYRSLLRTHLVIGEAIGELARWPPLISVYQDQTGITLRRYGISSAGVYLVRPDGYVAFRAPGLGAVEGFVSYLEAVLKRPSSRAVPIHQSRAP